ncbi:MAG: hypothetical protein U0325_33175 [Polyangiales bacterium]
MVMQVDPRRNALALGGNAPHEEPRGEVADGPSFDAVLRRETPPEAARAPREAPRAPREPARGTREAAPRDTPRARHKTADETADAGTSRASNDDERDVRTTAQEGDAPRAETDDALAVDPRLAWMIQVPAQPQAPAPLALALELSRLAEDPAAMESIARQEDVRTAGDLSAAAAPLVEAVPTAPEAEAAMRPDAFTVAATQADAPRPDRVATPGAKDAAAPEARAQETPRAAAMAEAPPTREANRAATREVNPGPTPASPEAPATNAAPATAEHAPGGDTRGDARRESDGFRERTDAPVETVPVVTAEGVTRPTVASGVTVSRDAAVTEAGGTSALRERLARAAESSVNRVGNEVRARGEVNDAALGRVVVTATQRAGAVDLHVHADRDDTLRSLKGHREELVAEVQTADVKVGALRFDGGGTDVGLGDGSPRHGAGDARDARSDAQGEGGGGAAQERPRGAQRLVEAASPPRSARVRAVL